MNMTRNRLARIEQCKKNGQLSIAKGNHTHTHTCRTWMNCGEMTLSLNVLSSLLSLAIQQTATEAKLTMNSYSKMFKSVEARTNSSNLYLIPIEFAIFPGRISPSQPTDGVSNIDRFICALFHVYICTAHKITLNTILDEVFCAQTLTPHRA